MKNLLVFVVMILSVGVRASDVTEIIPVSDKLIMIRFDDGYIYHYGYHEKSEDCVSYMYPLDTVKADNPLSYTLQSPDDPSFATAVNPVSTGRKTKGHDFSRKCIWINEICDNDVVMEHFIYLFLETPMMEGKTYILSMDGLGGNYNRDTLHFGMGSERSEAVHVNQVGFLPDAQRKYAYVSQWMGDAGALDLNDYAGVSFHILDLYTREEVYTGTASLRLDLETSTQKDMPGEEDSPYFSMSDVLECDFSDFSTPGEYVVAVEKFGHSYPFEIGEDIYREAYYHAARALFHHRTGIALPEENTQWHRPRTLHPGDGVVSFQYSSAKWESYGSENGDKEDVLSKVLPDFDLQPYGWYMDAGDWDGYYTHTQVPHHLLTAYELAPDNFFDGQLNIPESGNGIPDILDEARWLIDYMDRTRGPSGGVAGMRIHPDFNKHDDGEPSWEDHRTWTIYGESPMNTFTFAGLCAQLAYCYDQAGISGGDALFDKAEDAYEWATLNWDPGSEDIRNARLFASAWMYKYSGVQIFQNHFKEDYIRTSSGQMASDNKNWAIWAYITTDHENMDAVQKAEATSFVRNIADSDIVEPAESRSFRVGFNWYYPVVTGQATTPRVVPALIMHKITGEEKYLRAALTTVDYYMGGNPLNMLWMTGYGDRHPLQVLHLDTWWHPDGREDMIPGITPYGPTNRDWFPTPNGPHSAEFAMLRIHPDKTRWPVHEMYFDNRYCPPTNEYTIHQQMALTSFTYGLLSSSGVSEFTPNQAPEVFFPLVVEKKSGTQTLVLQPEVNDPDGTVMKVEFYQGWHKIGETDRAPFAFEWKDAPEDIRGVVITAVAVDNKGAKGRGRVELGTGNDTFGAERKFNLFPNPAADHLKLRFSIDSEMPAGYRIYTLNGQLASGSELGSFPAGTHEVYVDLKNLKGGTYVLKFEAKQGSKLIKYSRGFIVGDE